MSKGKKNTMKTTFFVACAVLLIALFATLFLPALVGATEAKPLVACTKVYKEGRISQMFAGECVYMTNAIFSTASGGSPSFLVKLTDVKSDENQNGGGIAAFQIFDENGKLIDSPTITAGNEKGYDQNNVLISVYKIFSSSDQFTAAASAQPYADIYVSMKPIATVTPTLKPTPTVTVAPTPSPACSMIYKEGKIFGLAIDECVKITPPFSSAATGVQEQIVKLTKVLAPPADCNVAPGTECKAPAAATFEEMTSDGKVLNTIILNEGDFFRANNILIQLNRVLPFASAEKPGSVDVVIVYDVYNAPTPTAPVQPTVTVGPTATPQVAPKCGDDEEATNVDEWPKHPMWSPGCQAYMDYPLTMVTSFRRETRDCATDALVKKPQCIIPAGGYCNFKCENRKKEQCYEDGTFDTYYVEDCRYANGVTPIESTKPGPAISIPQSAQTYKISLHTGWNMISTPLQEVWAYNPKLEQTVTAVDALVAEKMNENKAQEKESQAVAVGSAGAAKGAEKKDNEVAAITGAVTAASSTSGAVSEATQVVEAKDFMQVGEKYALADGHVVVLKDASENPVSAVFEIYDASGNKIDEAKLQEGDQHVYDKNGIVIHLGRVFIGASGVVYVQAKFASSTQTMQTTIASENQGEAKKEKEAQAIASSTQVAQATEAVQVGAVQLVTQEAALVNLPSNAVSAGGRIYETDCKPMKLFSYDANKGQYDSPGFLAAGTMLAPTTGYWVYSPSACSITVEGTEAVTLEGARLQTGWNLVGGPLTPTSVEGILGKCEMLGGPWYYNSAKSVYEKASAFEPGKAYFVRVKSTCTFGSVSVEIPSMPEMPGFPEWVSTSS